MCFIYFCSYFIYNVFVVHMVIYARGQGISQAQAVSIIVFLGASGIAGRILWGIFADILGNRKTMVLSALLMMLSLFWLQAAGDLWTLILIAVAFGFSHGGLATMESPMVAQHLRDAIPRHYSGPGFLLRHRGRSHRTVSGRLSV